MKKLLVIATLMVLPVFLSASQYVGISAGTNNAILTNRSDSGLQVGIQMGAKIGFDFDSGLRSEFELSYRKQSFKTAYHMSEKDVIDSKEHNSIYSLAYMTNVLYDVEQLTTYSITPYIGVGVGYCQTTERNKIQFDNITQEDKLKDNRFAYQAIVGAKYPVLDKMTLGLEYKYFVGRSHQKDHTCSVELIRNF
jgi:outer membrane autotransporter protein